MEIRQAYPFQKRVAELLLIEEQNVILQAPTGVGKTHAAMLPYLNALENKRNFPQKCIYSVPMRVLAKQFVGQYREAVNRAGRNRHVEVSIQTGEQPEDREFAANLIFATIDQTLSSFLNAPYSLPKRRANLNVGAVMSSYLVFDEFHLFDPQSTLPTALQMLQTLQGITPFILMTATFSSAMLSGLAEVLEAEVVSHAEIDFSQIPSQQNKKRHYHVAGEPLTARAVLDQHRQRTVVICNTVDRAMALYEALLHEKPNEAKVLLLHSRFYPADREKKEKHIQDFFGKTDDGTGSYIVVSTQAIEVGVDITSDTLHTELAPANAILQRAGRCARYEGDEGNVFIYQHSLKKGEIIDLCEETMPYKSQCDLFHPTLAQFQARQGAHLKFTDEQEIVSAVHGKDDQQILNWLHLNRGSHQLRIWATQAGDSASDPHHLIREVASRQVIIHSNPDALLDSPFDVPSFGLHPGTLQGYITEWKTKFDAIQDDDEAPDFFAQYLFEHEKQALTEENAQANLSRYEWRCVRENAIEALGSKLVVVHPHFATYHPDLGFIPHRGERETHESPISEKPQRSAEGRPYTYRLETYETHIRHVHEAFLGFWAEAAWAARKLEERFQWEEGSVREAAELAVLLHDVGKLSQGWQGWVRKYQTAIGRKTESGKAYAHTDFDGSEEQKAAAKTTGKRPWHAVESAIAAVPFLHARFGSNHPLTAAVFSAIARHHAPYSDECMDFQLEHDTLNHVLAVSDTLPKFDRLPGLQKPFFAFDGKTQYVRRFIAHPSHEGQYLAYLLIVRLLRLADNQGTAKGATGR